MYADFKSILKPVNEDVDVTQGVETGVVSSYHGYQEHFPCSFAYKIVSSVDPDFSRPLVLYRGETLLRSLYVICNWKLNNCLTNILLLQKQCCLLLQDHDRLSMPLSVIYVQNHLKMRVHCHITGNDRGDAHNECNLMYRIPKTGWEAICSY